MIQIPLGFSGFDFICPVSRAESAALAALAAWLNRRRHPR
jgi:hypothetical protein